MKKISIFGRMVPVWLLVTLVASVPASAALLTYYGVITTTATVEQSILLDGMTCTGPNGGGCTSTADEIPEEAPGGEKFCFKHTLKNQMSIDGEVNLEEECMPDCDGITTTCLESADYSFGPEQAETYNNYKEGGVPVEITVEDDGECHVVWTFDFGVDDDPSDGHMAYGLVISTDGVHPAFQVHDNDGTDSSYPWGTHLYSEWGPEGTGYNGWHTGDTNTPVSGIDWIEATGTRYMNGGDDGTGNDPTANPEAIFTVAIDKCKLGVEDIYWAAHFSAGGFSNYGGLAKYPETWSQWSGDSAGTELAHIANECSDPFSIASGATEEFCLCYEFAENIMPGTYTITTNVVPV
jgi:hypothetical protein